MADNNTLARPYAQAIFELAHAADDLAHGFVGRLVDVEDDRHERNRHQVVRHRREKQEVVRTLARAFPVVDPQRLADGLVPRQRVDGVLERHPHADRRKGPAT